MKKLLVALLIFIMAVGMISCNTECKECKEANQGIEPTMIDRYQISQHIENIPLTVEAEIKILPGLDTHMGTILGNNDNWSKCVIYSIGESGRPTVFFKDEYVHLKGTEYVFDKVDVRSFEYVHLAITYDVDNARLSCYINGELKQSIENVTVKGCYDVRNNFLVAGDYRANLEHFKGSLKSIALFSDVRTAEEIKNDSVSLDNADGQLLASYRFDKCSDCMKKDLSQKENDLLYRKLWLREDEVAPLEEYSYSFAVIGDTQELSEKTPEKMATLYNWIINNVESQNIKCVLGLGDITQKSYENEWVYAKEQIYKMNGVVPYTLVRGNHDKTAGFNNTFNEEVYRSQLDGVMTDGSVANAYKLLDIGSNKYLIMILDYGLTDKMIKWANETIEKYPDRRVIVTTHQYMYRDGTTLSLDDAFPSKVCSGDDLWEKVIKKHANIELVLSGHDPWQEIVCTKATGDKGNTVYQFLIDPQNIDAYLDGTAMVAMLYFSEDGNTIQVRYYSTDRNMYGSEISQFTITLE